MLIMVVSSGLKLLEPNYTSVFCVGRGGILFFIVLTIPHAFKRGGYAKRLR